MAIYHLHVKNISRGDGRSVVAAAAYRAGETLPNEAEERESVFGGRRDIVHAEICLPANAPRWMADRAQLWNGVEATEKRKDARLAKEIEVALPRELSRGAWLTLGRAMAQHYATLGFVADFAVHDDGTAHNPHVHILLTTRVVTADGFGGKIREADGLKFVTDARALWASLANAALAAEGFGSTIDPRSHEAAGVRQVATTHRGPDRSERHARRENMGLSRLLPPRVKPESDDRSRMLDDWPASQFARRGTPENDLPVPDPNGGLISQTQLDEAQDRMLSDMERSSFDESQSRRWTGRGEQTTNANFERDTPVAARRWERKAPDSVVAETRDGPLLSRRWLVDEEQERSYELEPVRDRVRD